MQLTEYGFEQLPTWIKLSGSFADTCSLHLSPHAEEAGKIGRLKVAIHQHGGSDKISNAKLFIQSISGNIVVFIGADDTHVELCENSSGAFDLRMWRKSSVVVGAKTTSNGTRIVCDQSKVEIGEDCMFSDGILIQSADQHGIVDLETGEIVNNHMRTTRIGDHVWLGRACTLMAEISIGQGSIIGTGAIVTRDIPLNSIAVGIPAKVVKTGMTWSRSPTFLDTMAQKILHQYKNQ